MSKDNQIRKAFRTTKLKINTLTAEAQTDLENLFMVLEARKTDAVRAERKAGRAVNQAQSRRADAQDAELELLEHAAEYFPQVAGDRVWMVYRDKSGVITLEGLTERLMRNNLRGQQSMMGEQLSQNAEQANDGSESLYEDDEEEENKPPSGDEGD